MKSLELTSSKQTSPQRHISSISCRFLNPKHANTGGYPHSDPVTIQLPPSTFKFSTTKVTQSVTGNIYKESPYLACCVVTHIYGSLNYRSFGGEAERYRGSAVINLELRLPPYRRINSIIFSLTQTACCAGHRCATITKRALRKGPGLDLCGEECCG